jgi:hypothetical protein
MHAECGERHQVCCARYARLLMVPDTLFISVSCSADFCMRRTRMSVWQGIYC